MRRLLLLFLIILLSVCGAASALTPLPVNQAFKLTVGVGKAETVLFHWQISADSYLYRERIHFKVISPQSVKLAAIDFPAGKVTDDGVFGRYEVYSNAVTVPVKLANAAWKKIKLQVSYQGCSTLGLCYAPMHREITINFHQGTLASQVASESAPSAQSRIAQVLQQGHLGVILLIFLGLGLLLAFTPCILPIIPILSSIIVGHGHKISSWKAFALSLVYVLSMSITYAIAGVVVSLLGENLQALLQAPWVIVLFSLLFVVLALPMFGLFELQLPERWRAKLTTISSHQKGGTYLGVVAMGVLSTLIVSPCVTPPLVGTLIFMANSGSVWLGALALFALGFGMGLPLLVIGTLGGKFLPKAGVWMEGIKKFFGFVMLGMALYLLSRILLACYVLILLGALLIVAAVFLGEFWQLKSDKLLIRLRRAIAIVLLVYGVILVIGGAKGNTYLLSPLASPAMSHSSFSLPFQKVKTIADVDAAVMSAHGKPVILDFYADWCVDCKEMDATTLSDPQVRSTLSHFVLLRANVTKNDRFDQALEKHYGVVAPPTFVFFDKQGHWLEQSQIVGAMPAKPFDRHLMRVLSGF